jgi:hypothetical protein
MAFELPGTAFGSYAAKLAGRGGIAEERITGAGLRSPSVQLQVTPFGDVEVLSTHDQVLGGPAGKAMRGARFPQIPGTPSRSARMRSGSVSNWPGKGCWAGSPSILSWCGRMTAHGRRMRSS